jgi:putative methyltransferase (TIGR04325 family)
MGYTLRSLLRDVTPPLVHKAYRDFRTPRSKRLYFAGNYATWESAVAASTGYGSPEILEKVTASTLKVARGKAVFERDSVIFPAIQYSWPLLAALMWIAAREGGHLRICDFGGALGTSYFQNRKFLGDIPDVQWCIVEQPGFVEHGQELLESSILHFHKSVDTCLEKHGCQTLLLSSILPYLESPHEVLQALLRHQFRYVLLDRTPVLERGPDRLTVQHVPEGIYLASYPAWFFNEAKLLDAFSNDFSLVEQFNSLDVLDLDGVSIQDKGYIFLRDES